MSAEDGSRRLAEAVESLLVAGAALPRFTPTSAAFTAAGRAYDAANDRIKAICRAARPTARLPDRIVMRIRAAAEASGEHAAWGASRAAGAVLHALLNLAPQSAAAAQVRRPETAAQRRRGLHADGRQLPPTPVCRPCAPGRRHHASLERLQALS